jgi:hypothetical protein
VEHFIDSLSKKLAATTFRRAMLIFVATQIFRPPLGSVPMENPAAAANVVRARPSNASVAPSAVKAGMVFFSAGPDVVTPGKFVATVVAAGWRSLSRWFMQLTLRLSETRTLGNGEARRAVLAPERSVHGTLC